MLMSMAIIRDAEVMAFSERHAFSASCTNLPSGRKAVANGQACVLHKAARYHRRAYFLLAIIVAAALKAAGGIKHFSSRKITLREIFH